MWCFHCQVELVPRERDRLMDPYSWAYVPNAKIGWAFGHSKFYTVDRHGMIKSWKSRDACWSSVGQLIITRENFCLATRFTPKFGALIPFSPYGFPLKSKSESKKVNIDLILQFWSRDFQRNITWLIGFEKPNIRFGVKFIPLIV